VIAEQVGLRDKIAAAMVSMGISKTLAETFAETSAAVIFQLYRGERVYFPKGRDSRLNPDLIWQEFTGTNHMALAKKFDCSVRRIEQIVAEKTASCKKAPGGQP